MEKNITKFSFLYDEKEFSGIPKEEIKTSGEKTVKTLIYKTDDGLEIERRETEFAGFDAVYTETVFKNNTDCESKQISKINDIDITIDSSKILESPVGYLPFDTEPMVWYNKGSLCQTNDFALATNWIRIGRDLTYKCEGGRSSNGTMPFFTYTQENEGYIIALGWSGQWRLIFSRNKENVFIKGGIEYCDFSLAPHESVRTMSAIILHYTGDMEEGQNAVCQCGEAIVNASLIWTAKPLKCRRSDFHAAYRFRDAQWEELRKIHIVREAATVPLLQAVSGDMLHRISRNPKRKK